MLKLRDWPFLLLYESEIALSGESLFSYATTTFSASISIAMVAIHHLLCCFNGNGGRETKRNNRYDVFLSFRGLDVRKGFVDHLYHALTGAGFHVFLDTHHLQRGEDISAGLQHGIEVSRILIPIFSINYAQSAWCLREVSLIEKGRKNGSAIVVPLFYNVTPTQVRHPDQAHGSPYAEALREHERSGKYGAQEIDEWKDALSAISRLSGWSLQENTNGYEAALVKRVVQGVGKLCKRRTSRL